jgi:glucose-6-phosphate 1-dehydrogenase
VNAPGGADVPHPMEAAPPCAMVIFGAAGDLTRRLLVPALCQLARSGSLPPEFRLVGAATGERTTPQWIAEVAIPRDGRDGEDVLDAAAWDWLAERMSYVRADLHDAQSFRNLATHLESLDREAGTAGSYLFYLAIPDHLFATAVAGLGGAGLLQQREGCFRRVVIEKPFGHDLASARALDRDILRFLREEQVYRIDHYLGKETVQNLMALRFANGLFEPIWSRNHIDHVQITAAETVGVERRGRFYEKAGALRDMVPNHLFQLLAMTAMEPPASFGASAVRAKKAEVVSAIRPMDEPQALENSVRGQYAGYREEPDVSRESTTETFMACRLFVDNWRWAGVPFYLRTGKKLAARRTEIAIRFHQAPLSIFRGTDVERMHPNWMILRIQPDEGIALEFAAKRPGPKVTLDTVSMDFCYATHFHLAPNTGYETLLYDCMIGDATLFQRADNIEAGWQAVQPLLDAWARNPQRGFPNYAPGSAGPAAADELLARDGRTWRPLA